MVDASRVHQSPGGDRVRMVQTNRGRSREDLGAVLEAAGDPEMDP
jgi:hypothetical protein